MLETRLSSSEHYRRFELLEILELARRALGPGKLIIDFFFKLLIYMNISIPFIPKSFEELFAERNWQVDIFHVLLEYWFSNIYKYFLNFCLILDEKKLKN